jgi:uncharacterized protein (DUF58 family)
VPARARNVFPLVPRYRVAGLPLGGSASLRRGHGSDVAGSRAYVRGDPVATIDWRASARLSTARGRPEFVVRERYAEESPHVVVLRDRRPSMGLYAPPFRWLAKPPTVEAAIGAIGASAQAVNAPVVYLDHAAGDPYWLPAARGIAEQMEARGRGTADTAPPDAVMRGLEFLGRYRSGLSSGTFVFVISDFLGTPVPDSMWLTFAARRWEAVPVVVQDPCWEQSFPFVSSLVLPLGDPETGAHVEVRLSRREVRERRALNERGRDELLAGFARLGLDPVLLDSSDAEEIDRRFLDWASRRRRPGGRR